jgi:hypothetical protein
MDMTEQEVINESAAIIADFRNAMERAQALLGQQSLPIEIPDHAVIEECASAVDNALNGH